MDIKKYLQQRAEEDFDSVLSESDKKYCEELAAKNGAAILRDRRKFFVVFSCAAAVLIAAIVTLLVIFLPKKPPLRYFDDNVVSEASTVEQLNVDSKYFNIVSLEENVYNVSLNYDSVSGHKLFYKANIKGFSENAEIVIVINENYDYEYEKHEDEVINLNDYSLNYYVAEEAAQIQYTGWVQLNTEKVYITYTQSTPLGDQAFFDYVNSLLKVK